MTFPFPIPELPKNGRVNVNVLLLLGVTIGWGSTFPLLKTLSADLSGIEISAVRFMLAALCMIPFWFKASALTWRDGALLGILGLISYVTQAYGLQYISSNRSAFITGLNVLMVPILNTLFFRARLSWQVVAAACLACAGIALMSWEGGSDLVGDSVTVLCALAYALYVIVLSQRANRHDATHLASAQIVFMTVIGTALMAAPIGGASDFSTLPARIAPHFLTLVYLGVFATAGMLLLQTFAQRNVSAEKAAVIYATEPVFAALFGWYLLGESLGARGAIGGAMIVIAMIVSEMKPQEKFRDESYQP